MNQQQRSRELETLRSHAAMVNSHSRFAKLQAEHAAKAETHADASYHFRRAYVSAVVADKYLDAVAVGLAFIPTDSAEFARARAAAGSAVRDHRAAEAAAESASLATAARREAVAA